jgi:RNA polymerase sigma-70 factor, ECF subfamily
MCLDPVLHERILKNIPSLRRFAWSLCRNRDRADDLLQETLLRGIDRISTFKNGSNLEAWLFTMMRNTFNSERRKAKRIVEDVEERLAGALSVPPEQIGWGIAKETSGPGSGCSRPSSKRRYFSSALRGLSYAEAAMLAGCQTGTIKSRVNRARVMLAAFMSGEGVSQPQSANSDRSGGPAVRVV